jgi:hypothetical protein
MTRHWAHLEFADMGAGLIKAGGVGRAIARAGWWQIATKK